jgi:HemY protein
LPIALTEARLHVQAGRYDAAIAILKPIELKMPRQPAVLDLLHHIYMAQKNWHALQDLLPAMRKAKVLSQPELEELELSLASAKIRALSLQLKDMLIAERLPLLHNLWKSFSRAQQKLPALVLVYAQALAEHYQDQEAEQLVRKSLANQWWPGLVSLYGRLQVTEVSSQIRTAEAWLKQHPHDAALLLCLGRLAQRNQQWDAARDYFQRSLQQQNSMEVNIELARLMEQQGEHKKSADFYQQGLLLAGKN